MSQIKLQNILLTEPDKWYSVAELVEILGCTKNSVRSAIRQMRTFNEMEHMQIPSRLLGNTHTPNSTVNLYRLDRKYLSRLLEEQNDVQTKDEYDNSHWYDD